MYRKILVPLDGSEIAEQALPHVRALADAFRSEVVLLRVDTPIPYITRESYPEDLEAIAREYLGGVASGLAKAGVQATTEVIYGNAAAVILDYAHDRQVDLIVMSSHGYSGFSHLIHGSVTQNVLHGAQAPVLVIRSREV